MKVDDRFGKSTVVTLGPRQTCSRTVDSLVYFANGMLDEWNPYEGLHQHTVAYASTRTLNVTIDAVAFSGAISRARGFPLKGLWNTTFRSIVTGVVCAKTLVIPVSAERSLNTYHQATCAEKSLLRGYRRWLRSFAFSTKHTCFAVLLIERPKRLRRHELNIEELADAIANASWNGQRTCVTILVPHKKMVQEQWNMVASSSMLIGTHGAALTLASAAASRRPSGRAKSK